MPPGARDKWDKLEIIGKLLGALVLPTVLFILGQQFNENASARDAVRQSESRSADQEQRRIDRASALVEGLASTNERLRLLNVQWARFLQAKRQLPEDAAAVLLEVATTDPDPEVAAGAARVAAEVAIGNPTVRDLAANTLKGLTSDARRLEGVAPLSAVVAEQIKSAQGVVTVPPCRGDGGLFERNCDRSNASVVALCSESFPANAAVRSTRVFTKWSGDPQPWEQVEAQLNADGSWNGFGSPYVTRPIADMQQVCVPFLQWSSHQGRDARIAVTYTTPR